MPARGNLTLGLSMDIGPSQPLLSAARADGVYMFCAAARGWTIQRDGKVIAIGDGDNKSIAEGIKRFLELTTPAADEPNRATR